MENKLYNLLNFNVLISFHAATCGAHGYTYIRHLDLCMKRHIESLDFDTARQVCQQEGGDLIRVKDDEVRKYLETFLQRTGGKPRYAN